MGNQAIIDLGSNTFHIVIYNFEESPFKVVFRKRVYVFLSEKGVQKIGDEAYARGIATLTEFYDLANIHNVTNTKIVGTATLRNASNGVAFQKQVSDAFDWHIDLITGDQEAAYIAQGVRLSAPPDKGNSLIMDIGGGSVEFILVHDGEIQYQQSFPIGISILYNEFHKSEPIKTSDIQNAYAFLQNHLEGLIDLVKTKPIDRLIGASGTFEIFKKMGLSEPYNTYCHWLAINKYQDISAIVTAMDLDQRMEDPRVPKNRAQHVVVAFLLIDFVIDQIQPDRLMISDFALKEGVISENISNF